MKFYFLLNIYIVPTSFCRLPLFTPFLLFLRLTSWEVKTLENRLSFLLNENINQSKVQIGEGDDGTVYLRSAAWFSLDMLLAFF